MEPERDNLPEDDERRIVELFAKRQPLYDAAAVRRITGTTRERLKAALAHRQFDPVSGHGALRFRWEDVASLALERWTPRQIAQTLERAGHSEALPRLNQVRAITIELPVYQIRLLEYLAEEQSARDGAPRSISDALERALDALAFDDAAELERRVPGFEEARLFPG